MLRMADKLLEAGVVTKRDLARVRKQEAQARKKRAQEQRQALYRAIAGELGVEVSEAATHLAGLSTIELLAAKRQAPHVRAHAELEAHIHTKVLSIALRAFCGFPEK